MLYRPWRNHEGQMTLFQQILRNPDVFNFGDHHHHAVAMEVLKHQPDNMDNRELSSWKSLELIGKISFSLMTTAKFRGLTRIFI